MSTMKEVIGDVYSKHPVRKPVNEAGDPQDALEASGECVGSLYDADQYIEDVLKYAKATEDPGVKNDIVKKATQVKGLIEQARKLAIKMQDDIEGYMGG